MNKYIAYLHSIWITQKKLKEIFKENTYYKIFFENLNVNTLIKYDINEKKAIEIINNKNNFDINFIDKKIKDLDINILTIFDLDYPELLKEVINLPFVIYTRWKLNKNDVYFSVVWSRKISNYAKKAWENIIKDLLEHFIIVSGGAWWCDTLAHEICLKNNKKTVVVFGTWIDVVYPVWNGKMYEEVVQKWWCLLSIFPIWTPWSNFTFPMRNEIVAWMSKWCLVLQAWEKSGTLITANLVLENSRDLFTIPSHIYDEDFYWNNYLIKSSQAKLITDSKDILEEYNFKIIKYKKEINLDNESQKIIFEILKYNLSLSIDEIMEKTWLSYSEVSLNISMLELKMIVKKDLFGRYGI